MPIYDTNALNWVFSLEDRKVRGTSDAPDYRKAITKGWKDAGLQREEEWAVVEYNCTGAVAKLPERYLKVREEYIAKLQAKFCQCTVGAPTGFPTTKPSVYRAFHNLVGTLIGIHEEGCKLHVAENPAR